MNFVVAHIGICWEVTMCEKFLGLAEMEADRIHGIIVESQKILCAFGFRDLELSRQVISSSPVLMPDGKAMLTPS